MSFFQPRVWNTVDVACLKWSCIFFGMILGAYVPQFVMQYKWVFALAFVVLAVKPLLKYFAPDPGNPNTPKGVAEPSKLE